MHNARLRLYPMNLIRTMPAQGLQSPYTYHIMKKASIVAMALLLCTPAAFAQQDNDSLKVERLEQSFISGVRVPKNAPFAVSNIGRQEIESFAVTGQELPVLFSRTPGVVYWSDNGLGTGTSYLRIRGASDSRINITLDGVPLNSPEDECVFWANMNSYGRFLQSVQIQRGVGSSTNGDGAFGGTVTLQTLPSSDKPWAEFSISYGSYNTNNVGVNFSTGVLGKSFIVDGAFGTTGTDGYVNGTSGRSGSWMAALTYLGCDVTVRYRNVGNWEKTGQAWNGAVAGNDNLSLMDGTYGASKGIKTYEDMFNVGLGAYNPLCESLIFDEENYSFVRSASGRYPTLQYQLKDGSCWDRTKDNFLQDLNILSASWQMSGCLKSTLTLHYKYGDGYYDEFRPDNKLTKFGLETFTDKSGREVTCSDFVRQKGLTQHTGGFIYNIEYKHGQWNILGSVSGQFFGCHHFGYLTYVGNNELEQKIMTDGRYQYYDSNSSKNDVSAFVKASYSFGRGWNAFADLQYRYVSYRTDGISDNFVADDQGHVVKQVLDINQNYNFCNPKLGLSYSGGGHKAYISSAMAHREPARNNFTDNGKYGAPRPEMLIDTELGYEYSSRLFNAGLNLYYMYYKDQFVQTGAISDLGEYLTVNIPVSYRTGVEMFAAVRPLHWLTVEANAALSRSRLLDFDEFVEDWNLGSRTLHYDDAPLAFSPSAVVNGALDLHYKGAKAVFRTAYVSRQYLDNTGNMDRSLPGYCVCALDLGYRFDITKVFKFVEVGLNLNNLFNSRYAASGWVYSAIAESCGHTNDNRYYQIGFVPMAGFTAMGSIKFRF